MSLFLVFRNMVKGQNPYTFIASPDLRITAPQMLSCNFYLAGA